eukprot:scaffold132_cov170-Amphora_coffeaeformis.AAC.19
MSQPQSQPVRLKARILPRDPSRSSSAPSAAMMAGSKRSPEWEEPLRAKKKHASLATPVSAKPVSAFNQAFLKQQAEIQLLKGRNQSLEQALLDKDKQIEEMESLRQRVQSLQEEILLSRHVQDRLQKELNELQKELGEGRRHVELLKSVVGKVPPQLVVRVLDMETQVQALQSELAGKQNDLQQAVLEKRAAMLVSFACVSVVARTASS